MESFWSFRCYKKLWRLIFKYSDENLIFPIAAILKHKQACEKKNAVCYIQISIFVPEIFKGILAQSWRHTELNFDQILWNKLSQPICIRIQKCLILCSEIVLSVLHNMSLTIWLLWKYTGFQTSPILKAFLATFGVSFWHLQMVPHMLDPVSM